MIFVCIARFPAPRTALHHTSPKSCQTSQRRALNWCSFWPRSRFAEPLCGFMCLKMFGSAQVWFLECFSKPYVFGLESTLCKKRKSNVRNRKLGSAFTPPNRDIGYASFEHTCAHMQKCNNCMHQTGLGCPASASPPVAAPAAMGAQPWACPWAWPRAPASHNLPIPPAGHGVIQ
jgi:hypothetical protein